MYLMLYGEFQPKCPPKQCFYNSKYTPVLLMLSLQNLESNITGPIDEKNVTFKHYFQTFGIQKTNSSMSSINNLI